RLRRLSALYPAGWTPTARREGHCLSQLSRSSSVSTQALTLSFRVSSPQAASQLPVINNLRQRFSIPSTLRRPCKLTLLGRLWPAVRPFSIQGSSTSPA